MIILLNQVKKYLKGELQPTTTQYRNAVAVTNIINANDRFAAFKQLVVPGLIEQGYVYLLACDTKQFLEEQMWCNENGVDSAGYCEEHQLPATYPRAFRHQHEALEFKLRFGAKTLE